MSSGPDDAPADATHVLAEFTIEPFVDGDPGPHVVDAIEAVRAAGLDADVGPFGTAVEGDLDTVLTALGGAARAAVAAGAERVSLQLTFRTGSRPAD